MLSLYRPGDGPLHRMPSGSKTLLILAVVLGVSLLPSSWWGAAAAVAVMVLAYSLAGLADGMLGLACLSRQLFAIRWVMVIMLIGQCIFLGLEQAVANTARVSAAIAIAGLLMLTTQVSALLDSFERGLRPLSLVRPDAPARAALLLTVTLTTVPVLARITNEVREAQKARGARGSLRTAAVPFLVMTLKHADELGDALTARGVQ